MFESNKTILFITKSRGKITKVSLGGKPTETVVGEFDFSQETLLKSLSKFTKTIGDTIRIVLSEDFVYVTLLSFPPNKILNKDVIREKAQEIIPQDLNQTIWDYKEVFNAFPATSRKIQVAVAVKESFEGLGEAVAKAGLYAEQIEPLSVSLARFTTAHEEPILLVYIYNEIFLSLIKKGAVLATERLEPPLTKDKLDEFTKFAKEKLELESHKIVFCGNMGGINLKDYQTENVKIEIQDLSPTISLAYKKIAKESSEKELNLNFPTHPAKKKSSFSLWILGIIFLVIAIAVEILVYFRYITIF